MEERVLPPGGVERTRLRWRRCDNALCGDDDCNQAGRCVLAGMNMIGCARCWAADHVHGDVVIVGPLTASVGVECRACGGRDLEVVGYSEPTEDVKVPGHIYYSPETKQLEVWR